MYLFIDEDGCVTKGETLGGCDAESWPSVIKIEISGMELTAKQLRGNNEWLDVPDDEGFNT